MPTTQFAHLQDRGIIRATGNEAETLLDGLLTNSLARLDQGNVVHTGLLSPQGKILFDFFLIRTADELLLDTDRSALPDLIKRLSFYRLRADVAFEDASDHFTVAALWPASITIPGGIIGVRDPRHPDLGLRLILPPDRLPELPADKVSTEAYHAHRIELGVPDAGLDYALADTFPHEALYDQLGSIDFKKGCFIGQEVVSRMQHRGTARKRAMRVQSDAPLQAGAPVKSGEASIGTIGSTSGNTAIATIRLDRAAEASAKGQPLIAGASQLNLDPPDWIAFDVATGKSLDHA